MSKNTVVRGISNKEIGEMIENFLTNTLSIEITKPVTFDRRNLYISAKIKGKNSNFTLAWPTDKWPIFCNKTEFMLFVVTIFTRALLK